MLNLLKAFWTRWKAFGHWLATVQSHAMLCVFYFIVLGPFALVMRIFADPLRLRSKTATGWLQRAAPQGDVTQLARRQF
jgi:hypothetical protein